MNSNESNNQAAGFITDQPLPDNQDFLKLKQSALAYIQQINGHVWSNYNETDPGVTILEQVCYAISELAYCSDFPIADMLTGEDGKIALHNQFFEPAAILTSNPLTLRDFQNLIFDRFQQVRAIYLQLESIIEADTDLPTGRYQVAVVLEQCEEVVTDVLRKPLCDAIHLCLNQHRNLAEYFFYPQVLQARKLNLSAVVHLHSGQDPSTVLALIQQSLRNYVLPRPAQYGFEQLRANGFSSDEIMSGPRMQHGWICERETILPTVLLRLPDISLQISAVKGVAALSELRFSDYPETQVLALSSTEYAELILSSEFILMENGLKSSHAAGPYQSQLQLAALKSQHAIRGVEAQLDIAPALPVGRYREIASYYSIQNTFPNIYGVGQNSLEQAAPAYRIAAARQLKAYLLIYDQILANQFAQTAHLAELFSFAPRQQQLRADKSQPEDRRFAQTYYWQTLYQVADVQNLLRGHEQFFYSFDSRLSQTAREKQAWKRFTHSAFNEYVYGLQQACESEQTAEIRREAFLNHMLARQGYFMADYDVVLQSAGRYGSPRRNRIIAKSVWLQNEQLLSYGRYTGFDPWSARKIDDLSTYEKQQNLLAQRRKHDEAAAHAQDRAAQQAYPEINGELELSRIWAQHKLRSQDLADYSGFECRLDQLLSMREHLQQLIRCLELVLSEPAFVNWLVRDATINTQYLPGAELYLQAGEKWDRLLWQQGAQSQAILQINWSGSAKASLADYQQILLQLRWLAEQRRACLLLEPILLLEPHQAIDHALYSYCLVVVLILPDYVMRFLSPAFQRDLQQIQRQFFPYHLDLQVKTVSPALMRALIHSYTLWHNHSHSPALRKKYASQLQRLLQLPLSERGQHAD